MVYNSSMKEKSHFSIRQVIDLTGVSEFTIRGWENRYQAITPMRTEKGRRLYTQEDLLKIRALKDLVERGNQISSIAHLNLDELRELLVKDQINNEIDLRHPEINAIIKNSDTFAWDKVQKIFQSQRKKNNGKEIIFKFILPLIKKINTLVARNQLSISREHILSAMIKEELYFLKNNQSTKKSKAKIVFATPEDELHEMGILLSSTLANLSQLTCLYLGVNTPRQQIVDVCMRFEATHLVVSSTSLNSEKFLHFVHFLDKHLPKETAICMGGPVLANLSFNLKREFHVFWTIDEINSFFNSLN